MTKQEILSTITAARNMIDEFLQKCEETEYTDTGDAADLFRAIRACLNEIIEEELREPTAS